MPLVAYLRGRTWWAKGRVELDGRSITPYLRESTGTDDEAGARSWIVAREASARRRHLVGDGPQSLTFADALALYNPGRATAKALIPIVEAIGDMPVSALTGATVRGLGPKLYPHAATDTWLRQVVTPIRAVINNAHDILGGDRCPALRVRAYREEERIAQDIRRGNVSRIDRKPGDWIWLLAFREQASPQLAALALFMFATGARIGQATRMHPRRHLDLQNGRACVPAAKGHADRWIDLPMEVVVDLANLPALIPREWPWHPDNFRVFGYAARHGVYKAWRKVCQRAGIAYLPPHSAGRHGFGQEMIIRNAVDDRAVSSYGGWRDPKTPRARYTHAEDATAKIHRGFRTGLVQAEQDTGLKLLKTKDN